MSFQDIYRTAHFLTFPSSYILSMHIQYIIDENLHIEKAFNKSIICTILLYNSICNKH